MKGRVNLWLESENVVLSGKHMPGATEGSVVLRSSSKSLKVML